MGRTVWADAEAGACGGGGGYYSSIYIVGLLLGVKRIVCLGRSAEEDRLGSSVVSAIPHSFGDRW